LGYVVKIQHCEQGQQKANLSIPSKIRAHTHPPLLLLPPPPNSALYHGPLTLLLLVITVVVVVIVDVFLVTILNPYVVGS
jgi:hypothetical protein